MERRLAQMYTLPIGEIMPSLVRIFRTTLFVYIIAAIITSFVLSSSTTFSQTNKSPTKSQSNKIPLAPCAALGNLKACKTFNEMLITHDADFSDLQDKNIAYICFSPSLDSFFRVNFRPFD